MSCVYKTDEFNNAVTRLDIHPDNLELIVYEFINVKGNEDKFPSDEYIKAALRPKSWIANDTAFLAWEALNIKGPVVYGNLASAMENYYKWKKMLPDSAVSMWRDSKGNYVLLTATPILEGLPYALDNTLLDNIYKDLNDRPYHKILKNVIDLVRDNNIQINTSTLTWKGTTMEGKEEKYGKGPAAKYNVNNNTITFDARNTKKHYDKELPLRNKRDTKRLKRRRGDFRTTVGHELVHAFTVKTLVTEDKLLSPKELKFKKDINALYEETVAKTPNVKDWYGLEDVMEFVAESFFNEEFQRYLASVKSDKGTLWTKLLDIFKYVLSKFNAPTDSILAHLLSATSEYMDYYKALSEERALLNEAIEAKYGEAPKVLSNPSVRGYYDLKHDFMNKANGYKEGPYKFEKRTYNGNNYMVLIIPNDEAVLNNAVSKGIEMLNNLNFDTEDFEFSDRKTGWDGRDYVKVMPLTIAERKQKLIERNRIALELKNERTAYEDAIYEQLKQLEKVFNSFTLQELDFINNISETHPTLAKQVINGTITIKEAYDIVRDGELGDAEEDMTDEYTSEMQSIKEQAIADGTFMKAPNGNPTNLNERQWLQVRTENFKNWFGDWINDHANASKVVDENGEPLVVYHTVSGEVILKGEADFNIFNPNYEGKQSLLYFTDNKLMSESYFDDNRVWKNIEEVKEKLDYYISLQNELKDKLTKTPKQLVEEWAKRLNKSVNNLIEDLGFDSFDEFLQQNWRQYTEKGINEQINEIQENVDLLNRIYNNPKLLNPTREFFINERNPLIVDAKGYNWNELTLDNTNVDKAIKYDKEKSDYFNELIDNALSEHFGDLFEVLGRVELIDNLSEDILNDIEQQVNEKFNEKYNLESTRTIEKKIINDSNYDGTLVKDVKDWGSFKIKYRNIEHKDTGIVVAVKRPNQIKSATDNNGDFSTTNDDVNAEEEVTDQRQKIRFSLEKVRSKDTWQELRGGEIIANLPLVKRDKIARNLQTYMKGKSGDLYNEVIDTVFSSRETETSITSTQALDKIINTTKDKELRNLARFIKAKLGNKEIPVIYKEGLNSRGFHPNKGGRIFIGLKAAKGESIESATEGIMRTIIHELAHELTVDAITSSTELKKEISQIMGQLSDYMKQNGIDQYLYAMKNQNEFIAEFMSQPLFREALKQMPDRLNGKPSNKFLRILDTILKALGLKKDTTLFDSAKKAMERVLDTLITEVIEELRDNSAEEDITKIDSESESTGEVTKETGNKLMSYKKEVEDTDSFLMYSVPDNLRLKVENFILSNGEAMISESDAQSFLNMAGNLITADNTKKTESSEEESKEDKAEKLFNPQQIKEENKLHMDKSIILSQQLDNLYSSDIMTATEVRHIAEQAVFWISDAISEYMENPESFFINFPNRRTMTEINGEQVWTEENKTKDIEKFKALEKRVDVAAFIGPKNLIELCKSKFHPSNNSFNKRSTIKKARLINQNWDAIMMLASDAFLNIEEFSIVDSRDSKDYEVNTELNADADNFNGSRMEYDVKEEEGSEEEHWQIETKTLDVLQTMSQIVRMALQKCYVLDNNGQPIKSEFNINERINVREATNSILRWCQGAITLDQMIDKLEDKVESNTWVKQIIDRLTDKKDTDFRSLFFSNFCKHFQPYSVVIKEDGKFKSIPVNEHPALTEAFREVKTKFNIGEHPLFTNAGVNKTAFSQLKTAFESLNKYINKEIDDTNKKDIAETVYTMYELMGYHTPIEVIESVINKDSFKTIRSAVSHIIDSLSNNLNNSLYNPFDFKATDGIGGNVRAFLSPITDHLEDIAVNAFYNDGKMYQSYITPSYTTKLFNKFKLSGKEFTDFIEEEYGQYEWFKDSEKVGFERGWRNKWLELLTTDSNARKVFAHKVQLSFNKKNYMRTMDDMNYTLSLITEYFSESTSNKNKNIAWYHIPMLSNKPSSEFIRFYKETGTGYEDTLTNGFKRIFDQELHRMYIIKLRNKSKGEDGFIKNFDKNGRKFCFLDFMNDYLTGSKKESKLGKLINEYLDGDKTNSNELNKETKIAIKEYITSRVESIINKWKEQGIVAAAKNISGIGNNEAEIIENLKNFIWNDTFASMNILQLTITDIAYYKDAEDLQKRLAQIHAPGERGNVDAVDYEGNPVSDKKFRTAKLTDFDSFISNIIDNVNIVFDRKIEKAKKEGKDIKGLQALKESLTREEVRDENGKIIQEAGAYRKINVADAQGYSCPSSYRKKAFIFGKWSKEAERVYQNLLKGKYEYADLKIAFQPLKPFVYSQITKNVGIDGIDENIKVPVQFKNSEYLLIMADALTRNEDTGRPNILRAIYDVMEDSHYKVEGNNRKYKPDGIDTIQFESTVKSGLMNPINLNDLFDKSYGEEVAKARLETAIYNEDGSYNENTVDIVPMEDYCIQQPVPAHFKEHEQAHGSQARYITISELDSIGIDEEGKEYDIIYTIKDPKSDTGEKKVTAQEFKKEYEENIAENINNSIQELVKELSLDSLSIKDRNIALSRILQQEIKSSPRYGVDLYVACSVDENGRFRIPLGDPIQSKRVEQLINSVIKNRINKQKIAGGPVVQVTNLGTTKELNIRFKDKKGNLLMTRSEYEKSNRSESFEDYIKKNQAGIAYFEVFAPAYCSDLIKQFMTTDGTIDVDTLELLDPDLLKMIGYRIPTEDKYSMAPLKIAGFLPREAGDGIMMPYDITLLNGSDFDVDKMYLMFKKLYIETKFNMKEGETMSEAEEDWFKHNKSDIKEHLIDAVQLRGKATKVERESIIKDVKSDFDLRRKTQERIHQDNLNKIEERYTQLDEATDETVFSSKEERDDQLRDKVERRTDKNYDRAIENENKRYEITLEKLKNQEDEKVVKEINRLERRKVLNKVDEFMSIDKYQSAKYDDALTREIRKAYLDYVYKIVHPATGKDYRDNKIIDMTYEVLTHESSADKVLNPGNFDPQKKMGYLIDAYKRVGQKTGKYSWENMNNMSIEELKDLCNADKNLSFIDTNIQFYKQNSAAGSLIGIFAVSRISHAILESGSNDNNGDAVYHVDVDEVCYTAEPFTVAGMTFGGKMPFDMRYDRKGRLIGKVMGSFVAASVDAVKDPILNLMNINNNTANILNSLIRMGMPFEDAALFLSQDIISEVIAEFNKENITGFKKPLSSIINSRIEKFEKANNDVDKKSKIHQEELTREELIEGLHNNANTEIKYKTLKMLRNFMKLADFMKMPTFATRFNSISSAVGPLIIDNLISERKGEKFLNTNGMYIKNENAEDTEWISINMNDIFEKHPILNEFYKAFSIAKGVFNNMPANSRGFRNILDKIKGTSIERPVYGDKKIMSALSDFYQSYLLVQNNVIDMSKLDYTINEFPKEFMKEDYKNKYPDNLLIQSIKYSTSNNNTPTLQIDLTGLDTQQKEKISNAWVDLHKINPELSKKLIEYNFFRGGIGFSPKTFMALMPVYIKERLERYVDTFRILPSVDSELVIDQFIRNNWDNDKLVPRKSFDSATMSIDKKGILKIFDTAFENIPYFKINHNNRDVLYYQIADEYDNYQYKEISPLGNNKEYLEISSDNIEKPITMTQKVKIDSIEKNDIADISDTQYDDVEIDFPVNDATIEDMMNKALIIEGTRTLSQIPYYIDKMKNRKESDKMKNKEALEQFFRNRFETLGIKYSEEQIEKIHEKLC